MGNKQHIEYPGPSDWLDEQERAYWLSVNKDHDARMALSFLKGLSAKGIVQAIATAKGNDSIDIFKHCVNSAIEFEFAVVCFLQELEKTRLAKEPA